jgi:organic radical activating enzyme
MHIGMDWREECGTSAERNGERLQPQLHRLLWAIGSPHSGQC